MMMTFSVAKMPNLSSQALFLAGIPVFLALLNVVGGALPVGGNKCGVLFCDTYQYCDFDKLCEPCEKVCERSSHNFDEGICQSLCQGYIHDRRYVKKDEEISYLIKQMQQNNTLSVISLVVSCVLLAAFLGYGLIRISRGRSLFKSFKKEKEENMGNNNNKFDVENSKIAFKGEGLKLDMSTAQAQMPQPPCSTSPSQEPVTPATTSTPLSRPRHPSEDTTLEYAYDNPALAPSPVLDKDLQQEVPQRKESSF